MLETKYKPNEVKALKKTIFKVVMEEKKNNLLVTIWNFYIDGFRNMGSWGRKVWIIILIKLFIMFAILRIFFFPDFLKTNFKNDQERSQHVLEVLTEPK